MAVDSEFSRSAHHCSLEAILGRTKLSKKTKIGDGSGTPGTSVPNKFQSNPVCSYPSQNFRKFVFSNVCQLQGFFDKYFVVRSHLRVLKLLVEFNDVFKTGLGSKIRTP